MIELGTFSDDDVEAFYMAYYGAFPELSAYTRPMQAAWTDDGTRLSFDKDLMPFVGASLGYNPNQPQFRSYLSDEIVILRKARTAIKDHLATVRANMPGGRFFFCPDGLYKKIGLDSPIKIANWTLRISPESKKRMDIKIAEAQELVRLRAEVLLRRQLNEADRKLEESKIKSRKPPTRSN